MSEVLHRTSVPAPFWRSDVLARHGAAPALLAGDEHVDHAELARRVAQEAAAWPGAGVRRLVLVEIEPTVESVVTYLAALDAGHVVLLAAPGRGDALAQLWAPDDRAHRRDRRWVVAHGSAPARHDLHPDLALLLSHVRLDRFAQAGPPLRPGNVQSNAGDDRRIPRADAGDRADHDPAAALLLRPVRPALAPGAWARRGADRRLGRRPVLCGARCARPT